jgi:hypothetical protein
MVKIAQSWEAALMAADHRLTEAVPNGAARWGYWGSEGASCAGTPRNHSRCTDSR